MNKLLSFVFNMPRLRLVLLAALASGSIFYFAIPPWWHYDEPGQFEYAWLLANDPGAIDKEHGNPDLRRNLAKSLDEYGWYAVRNYRPDFESSEPMWIGTPQTGDRITVGYYVLMSLPLRLFRGASIINQYRLLRFISLLFFLATIFLAGKISELLFAPRSPLRWMVPVFLATLPGFIDMMLSVSNDVAAAFSFSLFLYASLRLFYKKVSLFSAVLFITSLVFSALAKNVTWFALVLAPLVVLLKWVPHRHYKLLAGGFGVGLLVLLAFSIDFQGASSWFVKASNGSISRQPVSDSPLGDYALVELKTPGTLNGVHGQCLSPKTFRQINRQKLTYGAWIWADSKTIINAPSLRFYDGIAITNSTSTVIVVDKTPNFFRFVSDVPEQTTRACLLINSEGQKGIKNNLYYDGFVLADGEYINQPPIVGSGEAHMIWDGKSVNNLLQNDSFESGGARLKPWVEKLAQRLPIVSGRLSFTLSTLFIPNEFGWFYKNSVIIMFRTFWADIAGNKVILPGRYTYLVILLVFVVGLLGAVLSFWRNRSKIRWDAGVLFLLSIVLVIGANLVQSAAPILETDALSSFARHNYPVIIPLAILLCLGWQEWMERCGKTLIGARVWVAVLFLTFMAAMWITSLLSCLDYFHPSLAGRGILTAILAGSLGVYLAFLWLLRKYDLRTKS